MDPNFLGEVGWGNVCFFTNFIVITLAVDFANDNISIIFNIRFFTNILFPLFTEVLIHFHSTVKDACFYF